MAKIEQETVENVRSYYGIICNRENGYGIQERVNIIGYLEKVLRTDFKDTKDFHRKIDAFFMRHDNFGGGRLNEKQNEMHWPNEVMTSYLRCSLSHLSSMRLNKKPLSKLAVQFINESHEESISEAKRRGIITKSTGDNASKNVESMPQY